MTRKIKMPDENKRSFDFIVVADKNKSLIVEELMNNGYFSKVMDSTTAILNEIKHNNYAGIIIDQNSLPVDPLELILNLREKEDRLPVFIYGYDPDEKFDRRLLNRTRVYPIKCTPEELGTALSAKIRDVN